MRLYSNNPRKFWHLALSFVPLWFVVAGLLFFKITHATIDFEAIDVPIITSSHKTLHHDQSIALQSYSGIWKRPLRQQLIEPKKPQPQKPQMQEQGVSLKLIGTAVEGNQSYAFVRVADKDIKVVKTGDMLESYLISKIELSRIHVSRDKVTRYLNLPEKIRKLVTDKTHDNLPTSQNPSSPPDTSVKKTQESDKTSRGESKTLTNYSSEAFLKDVRLIPWIGPMGRQEGFRIDSISSDSLLLSAGFKPGDVITSVDGRDLIKLKDMDLISLSLSDTQSHKWQLNRQNVNIEVNIN